MVNLCRVSRHNFSTGACDPQGLPYRREVCNLKERRTSNATEAFWSWSRKGEEAVKGDTSGPVSAGERGTQGSLVDGTGLTAQKHPNMPCAGSDNSAPGCLRTARSEVRPSQSVSVQRQGTCI